MVWESGFDCGLKSGLIGRFISGYGKWTYKCILKEDPKAGSKVDKTSGTESKLESGHESGWGPLESRHEKRTRSWTRGK